MAKNTPTWLLIPGAWALGPDVLFKTQQALTRQGARVYVPSLPKAGADNIAQASVDRYADACVQYLREASAPTAPLWVMAHSAGGGLVPAVVARCAVAGIPVAAVVLVSAFIPVGGQSVIDLRPSTTPEQRAGLRAKMQTLPPEGRLLPIPTGTTLEALYLEELDATEADTITTRLVPEPFAVLNTQTDYTPLGQQGQRIPVHYVFCDHDKAIPPDIQAAMHQRLRDAGCAGNEQHLAAGHNVILSHAEELAHALQSFTTMPATYRRRWWQFGRK